MRARETFTCMTQVAINWTICKGAVPIPGAKNARQAKEAAGALMACPHNSRPFAQKGNTYCLVSSFTFSRCCTPSLPRCYLESVSALINVLEGVVLPAMDFWRAALMWASQPTFSQNNVLASQFLSVWSSGLDRPEAEQQSLSDKFAAKSW